MSAQFINTFLFTAGLLLLILSIPWYTEGKYKTSVLLLVTGSFLMYLFAATLFNYLNIWDERFHALVGKNMLYNPLKPTLYREMPITAGYDTWDKAHVWLHKQPFFLWLIAISYSVFGVNEFALRFPSAVIASLMVVCAFRVGNLLANKKTGYYLALIFATSNNMILLVSGYAQLDHNDICFVGNICFSIWAWLEYLNAPKKRYLILIGLFSGLAILTKWLAGLLVYLLWAIYITADRKKTGIACMHMGISLAITGLIFLPWQLYCYMHYHTEWIMEMKYNSAHFYDSVEGHDGPWYYHLKQAKILFDRAIWIIFIPSVWAAYKEFNNKKVFISFLGSIIFILTFFTIAKTRMPSFTLIGAPLVFAFVAAFLSQTEKYTLLFIKNRITQKIVWGLLLLVVLLWRIDVQLFRKKHGFLIHKTEHAEYMEWNAAQFKNIQLPTGTLLFGVKGKHYVECMFYTPYIAYPFLPSVDQLNEIANKKIPIAIIIPDNDSIPEHILKSTYPIHYLPIQIKQTD